MLPVAVGEWIGNAAVVVSGVWGAVTRRAEQSGYSRTAIYAHAERVVQAVDNERATGISYEELWAERSNSRPKMRPSSERVAQAHGIQPGHGGRWVQESAQQSRDILAVVLPGLSPLITSQV